MDFAVLVETKRDALDGAETKLDVELKKDKDKMDEIGLRYSWSYYKLMYKSYDDAVGKLLEIYFKGNKPDDYKTCNEERVGYLESKLKYELLVDLVLPKATPTPPPAGDSSLKLLLPKRELPQFSGDVREWLAFWASFEEIHTDGTLKDVDKFHYLVQSTKEGTPARKLVNSFPFSAANYTSAVKALKDRFGRSTVLVKVYVRDLLQLVIEASTGKQLDFGDLVTAITSQIRNLDSLGVTSDKCAQVLYPVVESCLPREVLQAWQRHNTYKEELEDLLKFLQLEVNNYAERGLANFQPNSGVLEGGKRSPKHQIKMGSGMVPTTSSFVNNAGAGHGGSNVKNEQKPCCAFCDRAHHTVECQKAPGIDWNTKKTLLTEKRYCYMCLRKANHLARQCRTHYKCSFCEKAHHFVMCPNFEKSKTSASVTNEKKSTPEKSRPEAPPESFPAMKDTVPTSNLSNQESSGDVPLQTIKVMVHGSDGKKKIVRAMVDGGSQRSYILSSLAEEMKLKSFAEVEVEHETFGGDISAKQRHHRMKVSVSDTRGGNSCKLSCSSVKSIANRIPPPAHGPWIEDFKREGISFNDLNNSNRRIEMLIGNDNLTRVYTGKMLKLSGSLGAIETLWGWVMCGAIPVGGENVSGPNSSGVYLSTPCNGENYACATQANGSGVQQQTSPFQKEVNPLTALWELEVIGIQDPGITESKKEIEELTQQHFDQTVQQLPNGRYEVSLPWLVGSKERLTSNYYAAERRLKAVTRDLHTKGLLKNYSALFQQWEADQMIEEVISANNSELKNSGYYLPHRAVVKLTSATTPIRPVFDGSAKGKGLLSLNDCLDKGPNLLEQIPPILTRFRLYRVGVTADIKKAFQQISVNPADRKYLKFLWYSDDSLTNVKTYQHCRVVFGVTSSPYLLGATLRHHLQRVNEMSAGVAEKLMKSCYVDNTILSVGSLEEAKQFQKVAVKLLLPVQFDLRGWEIGPSNEDKITPVLGLQWNMKSDVLTLDVSKVAERIDMEPTLRHILSLVHGIYDPLGFACPFTIVGKLLLRKCHEQKSGLDTKLPDELKEEVFKWARQIPVLSEMQIPRHVCYGESAKYSIQVFCDSSSRASAAAVYLRMETQAESKVFLLAAKSRVAPLKRVTIPRLELVACVIASRLLNSTLEDIGKPELPVTFWSDSSTALAWIRGVGPWGVFVTNCVEKVKKLTQVQQWRHIPGKENIADIPSRGCSAKQLVEHRWWDGPTWLSQPRHLWPVVEDIPDIQLVESERRKTVAVMTTTECNNPIANFLKVSDYTRILRYLAIWLRFKKKLQEKMIQRRAGAFPVWAPAGTVTLPEEMEVKEAERFIIKYIQLCLHDNPERMRKLNPFNDEDGIIRIRTRLTHDDDDDFKRPILLPDKNEFVRRLMRWEHEQHSHVGATTLLSYLREKFWIINGRRMARSVVTSCWTCRRFGSKKSIPAPAPLPKSRTELGVPFQVTGLDMAGPLILRGGEKVWILLLTCATYRAVHLELVGTLSADGFIQALRRFVSRRGRPEIIYSDNGRGFVAANKAFQRFDWKKVAEYATVSRIEWRFNPPAAPWWGGFWERMVGMVKQLLRRILGKRVVHMGELETLVCEVEDAVNNRPLTYATESPDDLIPLTPNMFVRYGGPPFLPEADLKEASAVRSAHRKIQHLREALRSRFRKEYLGFLRGYTNMKSSNPLKVGDVVIVEQENAKRMEWPLGLILEAIPGRDGVTRLFRVKTRGGEFLRPAQRLFLMETKN